MGKTFALLIVDDDIEFLNSVSKALQNVNQLQVLTASTAEAAVQRLAQADAVLADCVFPYAEDFEAIVKKTGKPMARMSGKVEKALNLQLHKPFTTRELLEAVKLLKFLHAPRTKDVKTAA